MKQPLIENTQSKTIKEINKFFKEYDFNNSIINVCDQCFKEDNLLVCDICKQYFHKECIDFFKISTDLLRCIKCKQFNSATISYKKNYENQFNESFRNTLCKNKSNMSNKEKEFKDKSKEKEKSNQSFNKSKNKNNTSSSFLVNNSAQLEQINEKLYSNNFMERNFNNKEVVTKQISNLNLNESQLLKHESINSISDSNHTSNLNNNLSLKEEYFKFEKRSESMNKDKGKKLNYFRNFIKKKKVKERS